VERLWHRWLDALEVPEELKPRQLRLNLELEQLTSGVRIRRLDGDREAIERQKLQKGDIVKRFDGRRVDKAEDLIKWLGEVVDRSSVEIVVLRDGRRISLTQPLQAGR
jgi:S1-C subfamily serine protease